MVAAIGHRAFSLIELVIVVVIIGIIGAIAIPRMSRGAEGATDSALTANLSVLRNAIDLYKTEQGAYPPETGFANHLTTYTNGAGGQSATKDSTHIYGPYLRAIPALPVGAEKGKTDVGSAVAAGTAWVYDSDTGRIFANTGDLMDARGKLYSDY
ncbi:MAG: type II secretion system protein [bacterium]|jgi:prepilin-type N-terminal cleavage/methylation domain-containing protein|nr:prepilin-type N-terminal cleavage/methylation domain-containing protein [Planctomycetaceae bacterium]